MHNHRAILKATKSIVLSDIPHSPFKSFNGIARAAILASDGYILAMNALGQIYVWYPDLFKWIRFEKVTHGNDNFGFSIINSDNEAMIWEAESSADYAMLLYMMDSSE